VEDDKTHSKKAQGGKRVMYTSHHPCWDAKNRYGLPDCVDFNYDEIAQIVAIYKEPTAKIKNIKVEVEEPKKKEKKTEILTPRSRLLELMEKDGITVERLEYAVYRKMKLVDESGFIQGINDYDEEFIENGLIAKWSGFCKYAKKFTDAEIAEQSVPFDE
jgi:hypothetical protein